MNTSGWFYLKVSNVFFLAKDADRPGYALGINPEGRMLCGFGEYERVQVMPLSAVPGVLKEKLEFDEVPPQYSGIKEQLKNYRLVFFEQFNLWEIETNFNFEGQPSNQWRTYRSFKQEEDAKKLWEEIKIQ